MKLDIIKIAVAALFVPCMTACMDFDTPSDEFAANEKPVDPVVYQGDADKLDYEYQPTEDEVDEALSSLNDYFTGMMTAQYYVVGGKDGAGPQEHQYQRIYSLNVDNYCGYSCLVNSSFMEGTIPHCYAYNRMYSEGPFGRFLDMKKYLANLLNIEQSNHVVEIKAIALLLFNIVAQENTDLYGSIPYVDHKGNVEVNPFEFNKGIDIYASIIENLDNINACLKNFSNRPQWYQNKLSGTIMMLDRLTQQKNVEAWRRMANSLKLRMAMHVVKVLPDKAKEWAEEAVAEGVVESKDQQTGYLMETGEMGIHPLKVIYNDWNDSRVNASFISLLSSLKHPYIEYAFTKNNNRIVNSATGDVMETGTAIVGVRAGDVMEGSQQYFSNMRVAYSKLNFEMEDVMLMPIYVIKWAEMDFLRAEGALRNWNMGGTAEFFYNRGIKNADFGPGMNGEEYDEYPTRVEEYMKLENAVPYTYVDPMNYDNNMESLTTIGVKWNDGDDAETKLEKIITQKYIAIFPNSYEAWTELRRTGYPKIFPVLNAPAGDGSLSEGELIHRMHLPNGDTQAGIEDVNNSGIPALGGPDTYATRVFWDTMSPNF